ncbi:hypothetical protein [Xanthomonas floridensis]|uniref:Uncharacterized protein n=1 Tax=Xanthomonas floridensis TaxID=1843580 RepID=A0ABU5Q2B1_9XANT|nr:hypothetical protein [Xanthomonas floridensis]MEA5126010.1 hypothetical protein [Xanthomonas floridensis]MEA5133898.1 hypothetical protein [Xanthomonas floridensis]
MKQWKQHVEQVMQTRLQALAATGHPRELYVSGLLWAGGDDAAETPQAGTRYAPAQRALLQRALDARPRDLLVARMESYGCPRELRCDPEGALAFLEEADADNADVHLQAYAAARRRSDGVAAERAWQAVVRADHFDSGARELGQVLHAVYADTQWPLLQPERLRATLQAQGRPTTGSEMAMVFVMGAWMERAVPSLIHLTGRCALPVTGSALRDECLSLFTKLAGDESTMVTALLGSMGMAALSTGSEAERWQAHARELQWLRHQFQRLTRTEAEAVSDLELTLVQGEVPVLRALLKRHGVSLAPPADWQPEGARP